MMGSSLWGTTATSNVTTGLSEELLLRIATCLPSIWRALQISYLRPSPKPTHSSSTSNSSNLTAVPLANDATDGGLCRPLATEQYSLLCARRRMSSLRLAAAASEIFGLEAPLGLLPVALLIRIGADVREVESVAFCCLSAPFSGRMASLDSAADTPSFLSMTSLSALEAICIASAGYLPTMASYECRVSAYVVHWVLATTLTLLFDMKSNSCSPKIAPLSTRLIALPTRRPSHISCSPNMGQPLPGWRSDFVPANMEASPCCSKCIEKSLSPLRKIKSPAEYWHSLKTSLISLRKSRLVWSNRGMFQAASFTFLLRDFICLRRVR
mmetsp:Transcript_14187/g.35627  ORF Transcript_14187/g.35627 Transcript_14187/m.35627 type:complete len:326 (-) Transcript_14187:167-1144(-)